MAASFLSNLLNWDYAYEGLELSILTFVVTIGLELWSFDTVQKVLDQPGAGPSLYAAGVAANIRNHFVFGWPVYMCAAIFCRPDEELSQLGRMGCISVILFVHSMLFYSAHRAFHSYPTLYRHHRFHHRFNVNVPPMAANSVSPVEYIVAYILPFTAAIPLVRPDRFSLRMSVAIVSFTNLFIHTPKLNDISKRLPSWLVSTDDHLEHHRRLNTKYAAPTFNIDYFVGLIENKIGKQL